MTPFERRQQHKQKIEDDLKMVAPTQVTRRKNDPLPFARFKLIGGPYHDMIVRIYPPWEVLEFPNGARYEIHPPLDRRSKRWVYVHNMNGETDEK